MIRLLMLSRTYLQASGSGNHLCITELSQWQCTCKTDADTTTSSQHAQPSGVLRRRSDGLECAAWRPPRPVAQCRQFPEKAKDASVSECTWTLSTLEALRNALYKFKTYLLTYLLTFSGLKIAAKYVCGRGSAPEPAGELTALPRPRSCIGGGEEKGKEWKRREGKVDRKGEEEAGKGREEEGREEEGRGGGEGMGPHFWGQVYAPEWQ